MLTSHIISTRHTVTAHTRSTSTGFHQNVQSSFTRTHTSPNVKISKPFSATTFLTSFSKNAPLADRVDFASCRRVNTKLNGVRTVLMFRYIRLKLEAQR